LARWILHVDMDAFFASVESVLNPALAGRPVIVCGPVQERSVVSAASYEARRYGVRSAMPASQARRLCPAGVFVQGNHAAYAEFSRRVLAVLRRFAPLVEQTSIDEAYLDITGCEAVRGDPVAVAGAIKKAVKEETGLTCSVGVGPNRLLAKMASGMEKPDGLTVIRTEDVPALLWPLEVGQLHGVGPRTAARLRALGLATVGDLARYPRELLVRGFGALGRYLHDAANGIDDTPVAGPGEGDGARSISRETTFRADIDDPGRLERVLLELSEDVGRRLRKADLLARTVTVKIRKADFTTLTRSRTFRAPTDLTEEVYSAAREAFFAFWRPAMKIRLLGVGVANLETAGAAASSLFEPTDRLRRVSRAVDRIKDRYGERSVIRARLLDGTEESDDTEERDT